MEYDMQIERRIRLLLIRHGQTAGNLEKRYNGCRTDESLCRTGREALAERSVPGNGVEYIFTSPMKRCKETAEILFPGQQRRVLSTMWEMDFGHFEGKNHAELEGDPEYQAWLNGGGERWFPGGEPRDAFFLRTMGAFREMLQLLPAEGDGQCSVALVCHGGNIMAIMSELTGGDFYDYLGKNGEGYELTFSLTGEDIHDLSYHSLYTRGTA